MYSSFYKVLIEWRGFKPEESMRAESKQHRVRSIVGRCRHLVRDDDALEDPEHRLGPDNGNAEQRLKKQMAAAR